ncbi:MAG TPA: DNA-binding domain-containing protein [Steroidobacteraceae bacterium]|nr:DNA-binding domain-containing protein [Steroidobacteraceae bacterium]
MSALAELQHAFQALVLTGNASAQSQIVNTSELSASARLAIYAEAYRLRLIEALASNYPRLKETLGEQEFDTLALRYIETHRSQHPSIRWYGHRLAELLVIERVNEPWLAELARWEWAVAFAFDAPDAVPLDASALSRIQPEQWSELRLDFHPSIQRLDMHSNAVALFKAFTEEQAAPTPGIEPRTAWLIWRQDLKTQYRSLEDDEAAALDVMRGQGTFADACEMLCQWHEVDQVPLRAASYMQRWLHDQLVCAAG